MTPSFQAPSPIETAATPDLRGSWPALQRAALRARALAAQTGTALVVVRNGSLTHVYPEADPRSDSVQESMADYGKAP